MYGLTATFLLLGPLKLQIARFLGTPRYPKRSFL